MAHVVIIDDDPLMYELYELILTTAGYKVTVIGAPEQALEKTTAARPDIILLDIMMPKINGLEVLELFKRSPELKKVPVIAFSNLLDKEAEKAALARGAARYIIKSQFQSKELQAVITDVLANPKGLPKR